MGVGGEAIDELIEGSLGQRVGRLQGLETSIGGGAFEVAYVFDPGPVDLADLPNEQFGAHPVGKLDEEIVDGLASLSIDDLDADDLGPDGPDPAGDGTEPAGTVGQPHPHGVSTRDDFGHAATLPMPCVVEMNGPIPSAVPVELSVFGRQSVETAGLPRPAMVPPSTP